MLSSLAILTRNKPNQAIPTENNSFDVTFLMGVFKNPIWSILKLPVTYPQFIAIKNSTNPNIGINTATVILYIIIII